MSIPSQPFPASSGPSEAAAPASAGFGLMPRAPWARAVVWVLIAAAAALVFASWLRPNMIFDLADMVFCN